MSSSSPSQPEGERPLSDSPPGKDSDRETARDDAVIGRAFRRSLVVMFLVGAVGGAVAWWLMPPPPEVIPEPETALPAQREQPEEPLPAIPLTDITAAAGIDFLHERGAAGDKLLPETMGGGGGFLDVDGDGDQDILLVNGSRWPEDTEADSPTTEATLPMAVLYLNDGSGTFTRAENWGLNSLRGYGMGAAFGDYDNDGDVDVYLTAVGTNRLLENTGSTFREVTETAGTGGAADSWSTSAGWFDYDLDGRLDLFVCNYVEWSREYDLAQNFQLTGGGRAYGRPQDFSGTQPVLYRNLGEGRFEEVTTSVGLEVLNPATGRPMAKSLGVTFGDFNGDGRPDIFVSNDTVQNFLFVSTPGGGFQEQAILTGVAFDQNGRARGAMGLDLTRFRGGDSLGIAIGNFASEMTALYVSQPEAMQFTDEAVPSGLGPQTRLALTFGVCFLDVDLDGREDLLTANGHLEEEIHRVQPAQHYEQPPQLFWNAGEAAATEFRLLTAEQTGDEFAKPLVGRGAAFADIDADGDQDMLIMTAGGRPRLLRNDTDHGHHWIRFQLEGTQSNRDAIGAMVELKTAAGLQYRQVLPTRSYLSQVELPVTFGLGTAEVVEQVTIRWPRGVVTTLEQPAIDTQHTVREPVEQTAAEQ